jgi:hypothetical protein
MHATLRNLVDFDSFAALVRRAGVPDTLVSSCG